MSATIITTDDLREFKIEFIEEMKSIFDPSKDKNKEWLRSSELRKILKISPGTLQNLRVNGTLPYTKIGGVIYYAYGDVMHMLESHKVSH